MILRETCYSQQEKALARVLMDCYRSDKKAFYERFRIFTKGLGVVCDRPEGVKKNQLVIEYFGEIYPIWRWYEK